MRLVYTVTWLLSATGLCQDPQSESHPPVGTMTVPDMESPEYYAAPLHETHEDALSRTITQFKLREWGFVVVRTTYTSDTKWAEFLTILNDNIRFWFTLPNSQHISHLYEKHVLTVLKDPAKLKNANLDATAQVFTDWVQSPQAKSEREGTVLGEYNRPSLSPRYEFYLLVDETTLNQVLRQHASRKPTPTEQQKWLRSAYLYSNEDNFSVKVVYAQQVQAYQAQAYREEVAEFLAGIDVGEDVVDEEDEEEDTLNMMKRVRIFEVLDLYAVLADQSSMWFNLLTEGDIIDSV